MIEPIAIQDQYPDDVAHCYGCGRLNAQGHHLKTRWDGEETVAWFTPQAYHTAIPGFVYGGLIASLLDCHGTGTAAAAALRAAGCEPGTGSPPRYVTASLKVDYLKPTPMGVALEIRGRVREMKGHRVTTDVRLLAKGVECARGEVVAVQMPESMIPGRTAAGA